MNEASPSTDNAAPGGDAPCGADAERMAVSLKDYGLWSQFVKETVVDEGIAGTNCTPGEEEEAWRKFCLSHEVEAGTAKAEALFINGLTAPELRRVINRRLRIEKFQIEKWGPKVEAYFLDRKAKLDRVVYSLIRLQDAALARELYFRIKEGEESFAALAAVHSKGPEMHTGGLIGPAAMGTCSAPLARILLASEPGQLWAPQRLGDWVVIVRLEKLMPVQLDDAMRRQLLQELFDGWVEIQTRKRLQKPGPAPSK